MTGEEQYFLLCEDPHELHDRIDDDSAQERIATLRVLLAEELMGRPEGFAEGGVLTPGQPYPAYMERPKEEF